MFGNNIIIMPSPRKLIIMNMQYNTGVRCNSIQSGVTISGQLCRTRCKRYVKYQAIACQLSSVIYQVSGIRCQVITCQVPVSDIKCQGSCVKYNMSSAGVGYQVSSITYQVPVSDIKCQV